MLGWFIVAERHKDINKGLQIVRLEAGINGLNWLNDLVEAGYARYLGGNAYPFYYEVIASALFDALANGVPDNDSPLVIGDDYVRPAGWKGPIQWDESLKAACAPGEWLSVQAFDQS